MNRKDHNFESAFDAAESKCVGYNSHLASINAPEVQAEIFHHLNDPTAIGNVKIMVLNFFNDNRPHKLPEILKFDPDSQMTSHVVMRTSLRVLFGEN